MKNPLVFAVLLLSAPAFAADGFTYTAAIPIINAIQPNTGPVGTTVEILGSNLTGATAVDFGSTAATSFTVNNANAITAVAPAGTGTVTVTVTTPAGTSVPPN